MTILWELTKNILDKLALYGTMSWVVLSRPCGTDVVAGDGKQRARSRNRDRANFARGTFAVPESETAGPSASSGFPVRPSGFGELRAAFFRESRIRGRFSELRSRKSGVRSG